jgi:ACS family tartrate transporter-like MFS transporter
MVLYFTYWFPASYRGRVFAGLYFAQPLANAAAAIASGAILEMNGVLGLKGWQWIFILEALPAALLAIAILKWMTDRPVEAKWLTPEERQWLTDTLAAEGKSAAAAGPTNWVSVFSDPRVIALSVIWFGTVTANYGVVFFMPQLLKDLGFSTLMTGFMSAVPYVVGIVGLATWGYSSDRSNERRWHLVVASALGGLGLAGAAWFGASYWSVAAMSVAMIGLYGTRAVFWAMPSAFLTGATAAAAFAFINSLSQIGGYVGPFVVGWIKTETNSFEAALYFLGACSLVSALVALSATRACSGRKADAA